MRQRTGFSEGGFPFRYLGVPITASKLSKVECSSLIDKIAIKIRYWSSKTSSYAGRLKLIETVIFGIYNFWASMFVIPKGVTQQIIRLCRDYLWGNEEGKYKKALVAWEDLCRPKSDGGTGLKNLLLWNKALIGKLVWEVAMKKDILWIKWIHGRYLSKRSWWEFKYPSDSCWYLKKLCGVKEEIKKGCSNDQWCWKDSKTGEYSVGTAYKWFLKEGDTPAWTKAVWSKACIPKHAIVWWLCMKNRLPVKSKLEKFMQITIECELCNSAKEDREHLLVECPYSGTVWDAITQWMKMQKPQLPLEEWVQDIIQDKGKKPAKDIQYLSIAATIYMIWKERNKRLFKHKGRQTDELILSIQSIVRDRTLFLAKSYKKYKNCIGSIE